MYNEPDPADPKGMKRPNGAKPYDQDSEGVAMSEGVPSTSRGPSDSSPDSASPSNYVGTIDSKMDSTARTAPAKTLRTRRFDAAMEYERYGRGRKHLPGILSRNRKNSQGME